MAQRLKILSQFGTIDTNNQNIALGSGNITTTGSVSAGAVTTTGAVSVSNGSFGVGTSTHNVNFTQYGKTIIPSANYSVPATISSGGTVTAGIQGAIINVLAAGNFTIAFPASPVDGQLYTIGFNTTQTALTVTLSADASVQPATLSAPAASTGYTFIYLSAPTKWYVLV